MLHPAWHIYQYLQWLLKIGSHATNVFIERKIVPMQLKAVFIRVETVPVRVNAILVQVRMLDVLTDQYFGGEKQFCLVYKYYLFDRHIPS